MFIRNRTIGVAVGVTSLLLGFASCSKADFVTLQNATATFTAVNPDFPDLWAPAKTIDGITQGGFTSWSIYDADSFPDHTHPETIVWETRANQGFSAGAEFTFTLFQKDFVPAPDHNIGRFRLSYTTDNRSLFADGLDIGGDVSANWVVIDPLSAVSDGGETFTKLDDLSLLVSGGANSYATYTVTGLLSAAGITGFRLEELEHPSLPFNGPGRQITNGNCHLSEFQVDVIPRPVAVPEPGPLAMGWVGFFLSALFLLRRRKVSRSSFRSRQNQRLQRMWRFSA